MPPPGPPVHAPPSAPSNGIPHGGDSVKPGWPGRGAKPCTHTTSKLTNRAARPPAPVRAVPPAVLLLSLKAQPGHLTAALCRSVHARDARAHYTRPANRAASRRESVVFSLSLTLPCCGMPACMPTSPAARSPLDQVWQYVEHRQRRRRQRQRTHA
ncbi:hypothetical protein GUJ93_ZPchr0003g17156 [Zizania palustris]|uniref:Uncharacterized protein n=1 Tax=Zizania palustris TaxID=103762 RepID=A0A8J5S9J0_ZIZPA|nr:hypothetical protein GUJ93_ZPchr0003g17156 [Zizania palustris]